LIFVRRFIYKVDAFILCLYYETSMNIQSIHLPYYNSLKLRISKIACVSQRGTIYGNGKYVSAWDSSKSFI